MSRSIQRAGFAGAALLVMLFAPTFASAEIGSDPKNNGRANRIVGIWDVDVAVGPCGGMAGPPFQALHMYAQGGTGQVVPSSNPAANSAHLMVWEHLGGNHYRAAMKFYRYDLATGAAIGYNIITNDVTISDDGNEYAGSGVAEFYAMDDTFQGQVCPQFAGTRFSG
ncbi:hypothetical protein F3N42_00400 [Marinihelvus fidelis]|uniref:DUF1579 domain-containing protein n=1 Tax=Marinihelvus fidelis TaxID=2613842 RepID=A0A5N0TJH0_9GAMM|nr:hypothetical protein [Marinihelvus fidelis]KAA9134046.1 hypothetical protein F3N42_00400 [Marinihelvus fidelis]